MIFLLCFEFYITMLVCGHHLITPYSMMEMKGVAIFKDSHFFLSKIFSLEHSVTILTFKRERLEILQTMLIYDESYLEESTFQAERNMTIFSCR